MPREDLEAAGLRVIAVSEEAGVHLATSEDGVKWVYFQGHPEYDANSLMKEYKREVMRYSAGVLDDYPPYPEGYFTRGALAQLVGHALRGALAVLQQEGEICRRGRQVEPHRIHVGVLSQPALQLVFLIGRQPLRGSFREQFEHLRILWKGARAHDATSSPPSGLCPSCSRMRIRVWLDDSPRSA